MKMSLATLHGTCARGTLALAGSARECAPARTICYTALAYGTSEQIEVSALSGQPSQG